MTTCILDLAHIQRSFYRKILSQWRQMWNYLNQDWQGISQGAEETYWVWSSRFRGPEAELMRLSISNRFHGENAASLLRWKMRLKPGNPYLNRARRASSIDNEMQTFQLSPSFVLSVSKVLDDIRMAGQGMHGKEVGTGLAEVTMSVCVLLLKDHVFAIFPILCCRLSGTSSEYLLCKMQLYWHCSGLATGNGIHRWIRTRQ